MSEDHDRGRYPGLVPIEGMGLRVSDRHVRGLGLLLTSRPHSIAAPALVLSGGYLINRRNEVALMHGEGSSVCQL